MSASEWRVTGKNPRKRCVRCGIERAVNASRPYQPLCRDCRRDESTPCPECGAVCAESGLSTHQRLSHILDRSPHPCDHPGCNRVFDTAHGLSIHRGHAHSGAA